MADYAGVIKLGVKVDDSGLNAQVEKAGSHAGASFTDALKGAFSFALGQNVFDFITNGFRSAVSSAFSFDSTMQSATTSFTTLLHSATQADSLVSQLNAIDKVSTLDMTDLSRAAQEMISFGVNSADVVPTIKELGDISQGSSQKFGALALAFSQTSSAGKLTGQDLLQYISAGFNPLQIIAQKTGKSMSDLRDEMGKGQISAADVAGAFKTATSAGGSFYNATSNASKTFSGQMDMLKSSVSETIGAMIKPSFNDIADHVLPHLNDVMSIVSDAFSKTGSVTDAVAAGLKQQFGPGVAGTFETLASAVKDVFGWIIEHKTAIISAIAGIGGAFAAFKAISAIGKVKNVFNDLSTGMDLFGSKGAGDVTKITGTFQKNSVRDFNFKNAATSGGGLKSISKDFTVLFGLPPQALIVIAAIGAIAALAVVVIKNWGPISAFARSIASTVQSCIGQAQAALMTAWNNINGVFSNLRAAIQQHKQLIIGIAAVLGTVFGPALIRTGIQTAAAGSKVASGFIVNLAKSGAAAVVNGAKITASFVASIAKAGVSAAVAGAKITVGFISSMAKAAAQAVVTGASVAGNLIKSIIEYAASGWKAVASITAQIAAWIAQKAVVIASAVATKAAAAAQWLLNAAMNANPISIVIILIASLVTALVVLYNKNKAFRDFVNNMWANIKGGWADVINGIKNKWNSLNPAQWGRDLIDNIANGIKGAAQHVKDAAGGVAQDIKSYLHFSEPDVGPLVGFHTWPKDMMQGLADDITSNQNLVTGAMQSVTSGMAVAIHPTAMLALAGINSGTRTQTIDKSVTKAPVINVNGNQYFTDAGSKRANLQQLDILAGY